MNRVDKVHYLIKLLFLLIIFSLLIVLFNRIFNLGLGNLVSSYTNTGIRENIIYSMIICLECFIALIVFSSFVKLNSKLDE